MARAEKPTHQEASQAIAEPSLGKQRRAAGGIGHSGADDKIRAPIEHRADHSRKLLGVIGTIRVEEDNHVLVLEREDSMPTLEQDAQAGEAGSTVAALGLLYDVRATETGDRGRTILRAIVDDHDEINEIHRKIP
jgi:hypothetical protein